MGLTQILHWITCFNNGIQNNELTMLEGDDGSVSPDYQDISRD